MQNASNGDTNRIWEISGDNARGVGSFHKTLPHNQFGEVDPAAFALLVAATRGDGRGFSEVPRGPARTTNKQGQLAFAAPLTNPQAGLAEDRLTHSPTAYRMHPAPRVTSDTTAAEMLELYWMALLRDVDLCKADGKGTADAAGFEAAAVDEINDAFRRAIASGDKAAANPCDAADVLAGDGSDDSFILGLDVPGSASAFTKFTPQTLFRLGLPGDDVGPMISQFFQRPITFGTQTIDARQRPYIAGFDFLTDFDDWLGAQNTGRDADGRAYPSANEQDDSFFEKHERYFATMRDLARFVNKDALHQAYFNAALILLSGGAKWPIGNPYHDFLNGIVQGPLPSREAGFGVLGGPHLLALVSEVATRALKIVWQQKWQTNLRLRPEAYGGLVHVQRIGVAGTMRDYRLPAWLFGTAAVQRVHSKTGSLLLPMAFTPGSPTHPAYGAGHATVAGACVTVLKAFFLTFETAADGTDRPIPFCTLTERGEPFGKGNTIKSYCAHLGAAPEETCLGVKKRDNRVPLPDKVARSLTIEGELNKLAQNVAMGRTMGGVHWRTDNTRSLALGEAIAAELLAGITTDAVEKPRFTFRTFARRADGKPRKVTIENGRVYVDGVEKLIPASSM